MKKKGLILAACLTSVAIHAQTVNQFTGSLDYNFPLLNIPSNRGTALGLGASYNAGIQVNQASGEIGLGWGINAGGAIYRSVSGIPDDTKSYTFVTLPSGETISNGQGALYPAPTSGVVDYDLARIKKGLDTAEFMFPDYDKYSISGPLSGQLKLSYLKYYSYDNTFLGSGIPRKYEPNQTTGMFHSGYFRKAQFHFSGDFADTLVSRYYPSQISSTTTVITPTTAFTGLGYSSSREPFIGKHLNGNTVSNQNFDTTSGRLATSNFVEYFTNAEIDNESNNSFPTIDNQNDFIDYKSNHARSSSVFPQDGIGYFRVTASNGLTYHYALPVYETENITYNIPLNDDYSLVSGLTITDLLDGPGSELLQHPDNGKVYVKSKTYNKIAIKWLLTAVTGADFVDANHNHLVDSLDQGYWVRYDYQCWSSYFLQRSPEYGYDYQYNPDPATQRYPVYFPFKPATVYSPGNYSPYKLSGLNGAVNISKSEVYHLSKIRTSSHTAIFVRDIRNDEKGGDTSVTVVSGFKPTPNLLLKRIILFKNEQLDSILGTHPTTAFDTLNYSPFNFFAAHNTANMFTEGWYQAQYNNLYFCILKHIAFDQDYSLCRKYHGNVQVNYTGSSMLTSPGSVESNVATATYSTSGKLTLNRILTYDFQNVKIIPSTKFDYNYNNSPGLSNPDYNPRKTDYWGYYKSDATQNGYSRYTTANSRIYTKVWSLLKITDPLGGITEMNYESNAYSKVIDNESPNGIRGASFIYRIIAASQINGGFNVTMEEGANTQSALTELPSFTPSNITGLKQRICIPYFQSVCYDASSCIDPNEPYNINNLTNGFIFGDCSFTVNTGGGGSTNNITGGVSNATLSSPYNRNNAFNTNTTNMFAGANGTWYSTSNTVQTTPYLTYSGNGFAMFEMPVGYEVYGGGIRVKQIKSTNSFAAQNETYVTDYTYENGVATNEMDRFNYQVLKTGCGGSLPRFDFLQPKNLSQFEMMPDIGYTKVTVKNLGLVNTGNGKTETAFITDPADESSIFASNFAIQTVSYTSTSNGGVDLNIFKINECINQFSNIFGRTKEVKIFDKNNNMLSRTVNTYSTTDQGALVENFHFQDLVYGDNFPDIYKNSSNGYANAFSYTVNILRDIPSVINNSTTYRMGTTSITKSLAKDEITGETTVMQSTGGNASSSISFKNPAYKYYQGIEALDFTSAKSRRVIPLGNDMYSYSNIDSTFTPTQVNGTSASFLRTAYKLYSKIIRQRQYNSGTGLYATVTCTLPYYANNRAFIFNAGAGSEDVYGLLAKTNLGSNPLNLSTINNTVYWEPGGTYNWKLMYEHTLLDEYKNMLESRDANNRFSAARYGYKGYYRTASVTNCNYASFTYAGFENAAPNSGAATMDGDMLVNNHTLVSSSSLVPHTGSRCIQVSSTPVTFTTASEQSPGNNFETGLQSGRIYRASVWTHTTNLSNAQLVITVNGIVNVASPYTFSNVYTASSVTNLATTIGNWNLLQIDFELPEKFSTNTSGGQFKIELKSANSGTVYFDDFIFRPVESEFSANVYNDRNGRTMSMLDANGLATTFVYDASGRTTEVWKEIPSVGYKRTKTYTYNYARGASN